MTAYYPCPDCRVPCSCPTPEDPEVVMHLPGNMSLMHAPPGYTSVRFSYLGRIARIMIDTRGQDFYLSHFNGQAYAVLGRKIRFMLEKQ